MGKISAIELRLMEKSYKLIDFVIEDLNKSNFNRAITLYNTLLESFESLKNYCNKQFPSSELIIKLLEELEKSHVMIIEYFEKSEFDNLEERISEQIKPKYKLINEFFEEKDYYEKFNINIMNNLFKKFKKNGYLNNIDSSYVEKIQKYYKKNLGSEIDPGLHLAIKAISGNEDVRFVPQHVIWHEIIPYLNDRNMMAYYSDKNTYDSLITFEYSPMVVLKRVNGQYFDKDNNSITRSKAFKILFNTKEDVIIKKSLVDDGDAVEKLRYHRHAHYLNDKKMEMKEIEKLLGDNFNIQEVIEQHPIMSQPHKYSVNTLRMVTLRWNDEIHYLTTFARFGANKSIKDNAGHGGLAVGISEKGEFNDFAIDKEAVVYDKHPTTGFKFKDLEKIPNFSTFIDFVKTLHKKVLHHNFVSWDIAVGKDGEPIFIEMNFWGAVWLYQAATTKPIFGDFTEEILDAVAKHKEKLKKELSK